MPDRTGAATCGCGCGSNKKHYARIGSDPAKWPVMVACDKFFSRVWAGEA